MAESVLQESHTARHGSMDWPIIPVFTFQQTQDGTVLEHTDFLARFVAC